MIYAGRNNVTTYARVRVTPNCRRCYWVNDDRAVVFGRAMVAELHGATSFANHSALFGMYRRNESTRNCGDAGNYRRIGLAFRVLRALRRQGQRPSFAYYATTCGFFMRQLDISGKIAPPIVSANGCERCGVSGGVVGVACVDCLNAECNREISALPLSATTIRQYAWTWRNFARWCAENRQFARPLDESIIQKWIIVRMSDGATSRTIAQDYAVLRALGQHWRETIEPGPVLVATLRKLRKNARDTPYRHARPLRPADLHAIVGRPQVSGGLRIVAERDTTAILLGWAIGARPQDLAALRWRDVDYIGGMLVVRVPPGKSGARVAHVLPARDAAICPVSILRRWAQILGETFDEPSDRPLFPRIDRWGNYRRSVGISAKAVADIVTLACKSAGLGDGFGGGSLRSGFVTSAAEAGVSDSDIARQTGHRTMSALARYRRELTATTNPALRLL